MLVLPILMINAPKSRRIPVRRQNLTKVSKPITIKRLNGHLKLKRKKKIDTFKPKKAIIFLFSNTQVKSENVEAVNSKIWPLHLALTYCRVHKDIIYKITILLLD